MKKKFKNKYLFLVIIFCLFAFFLRFKGLSSNYSFWTDEDHVAIFSRAIIERGSPVLRNGYSTGSFQEIWYWVTALSMKFAGVNELGARLPSVFFGTATILAVYFLAKKIFGVKAGLISCLFITFLTIEILWSRQARPYQSIQFFYVLETLIFINILDFYDKNKQIYFQFILLFLLIVASSLIHWFGLMPPIFFIIYLIFIRIDILKKVFFGFKRLFFEKTILFLFFTALVTALMIFLFYKLEVFVAIRSLIFPAFNKIGFYNHFAYYHSFLWRQYGLLFFLFLIGFLVGIFKNFKINSLFLIIVAIFFGFVNFRLRVPFSRYLYPIFFIFVIFAARGLEVISDSISNYWPNHLLPNVKKYFYFILAIFIVINGYKFTVKPKSVYSLNADMQEIPEVDFQKMYSLIKNITKNSDHWVLATTWTDHATWYLGEGRPDYWLRQEIVTYGQKVDQLSGAKIINDVSGFNEIVKKNKQGILVFESWEPFAPEGLEDYADKSLKKEVMLDRIYPDQPRYWPITVYSWGF